jgi:hypothetical protein
MNKSDIGGIVRKHVSNARVIDIHTHLFPANFGELALWGPDELLTYHYLIAEAVRAANIKYDVFWEMEKKEQASFIFKTLFIERSPLSESCRGILTIFKELGIDLSSMNLNEFRSFYSNLTLEDYINKVFEVSGVEKVVMTNDPFDKKELMYWEKGSDKRFLASLRLDTLINDYPRARYELIDRGYEVGRSLNGLAKNEIKRFLSDSIEKINAVYMAVSLPPDFEMPSNTLRDALIEDCVIPVARELNRPLALMIGARRAVNPDLMLAGDSLGKSDIESIEYLCRRYPNNKFMVTMLSRENQHELCVTARKFTNLLLFGCWWFLNNPVLIEEITRMRLELLGTTFVPQHSDARILDQLIYKWKHSKAIIADVLINKYEDLYDTGWPLTEEKIEKDVKDLFGENFKNFIRAEF